MLRTALELFVPLIISNSLHMYIVKKDILKIFKKPISKIFFGKNKTYRGFLFVGPATGILQLIFNYILYGNFEIRSLFLGFMLGVVYMLCELPNSYIKRRMGIESGKKPLKYSWFFTILDKSDSTLGVCLTFILYKQLEIKYFFLFFLCAFFVHLIFSKILYHLKIKEAV